jgi:hypothetical protein
METASVVLEYMKVLLSAPPIAGAVVTIFLALFRDEIRTLIRRTASIRFPGGELSTSQIERTAEELAENPEQPALPTTEPPSLPPGLTLGPEEQRKLFEFIKAERARAALWEYRFLNLYLVRNTQRVLDWLASLSQRTTFRLFDAFWAPIVPNPQERQAIIDALANNHLIQISGELIEVTPKGREYIQWRGPLPELTGNTE